jgi:hypothetical protein
MPLDTSADPSGHVLAAFRRLAAATKPEFETLAVETAAGRVEVTASATPQPDGRTRLAATGDGFHMTGLGYPDGRVLLHTGKPAIVVGQEDRDIAGGVTFAYLFPLLLSGILAAAASIFGHGAIWFSLLVAAAVAGLAYQFWTGTTLITRRPLKDPRAWTDLGMYILSAAGTLLMTYTLIQADKAW